ncbi:MAG: Hsp20 family protein [Candidatus Lokiarchaeota archaeon]|nr:Hsp20 family protein [Candidatus Lokiarchaeota archaeon]
MAETLEKDTSSEMEQEKDKPSKLIAYPQIFALENEDSTGFDIEVYLPGVDKDTIKLKMDAEYIYIAGETDTVKYTGFYSLCCPVDPEKAKTIYKEGLLKIHVPYKEIEMHTIDVKIE